MLLRDLDEGGKEPSVLSPRQIQLVGEAAHRTGWPQSKWEVSGEITARWQGEVWPSPPEKWGGGCKGCGVKKGLFLLRRFLRYFFMPVDMSEKKG